MCGRFTLSVTAEGLQLAFPWLTVPEKIIPRYNIAPTQPVAVVPNDSQKRLDFFMWGLIPHWAKDPKIGSRMINARAETASEKPSFKAAYRYRRCLILTDGFFEWQKNDGGKKVPHLIRMKDGSPFAFAGLWERWYSPFSDELLSCTIITTEPNELVKPIHNRMPVILEPSAYDRWLDEKQVKTGSLDDLLKPFPPEHMEAQAVSDLVNNARVDTPECITPAQQPLF